MKLYGKEKAVEVLEKTARQNRLPHAIMFSGKSGVGKKALALYAAQLILCDNNACGECACCRNIENGTHPDVIFVKKACGGKYSAEPFREVLKNAVVLPNNGKYKVYVFEDCDTMLPVHFNALLKLVEEPASHLRFVFTCANTALVPETILSRVTEYAVPDPTVDDCERFLIESGVEQEKAKELSETFSGNIGECLESISGDESKTVASARDIAAAIAARDMFSAYAKLSAQSGRNELYRIFDCLVNIFRDAQAIKYGESAENTDKDIAQKIANNFSEEEIMRMSDTAFEICSGEVFNLNAALCASYFISGIMDN